MCVQHANRVEGEGAVSETLPTTLTWPLSWTHYDIVNDGNIQKATNIDDRVTEMYREWNILNSKFISNYKSMSIKLRNWDF